MQRRSFLALGTAALILPGIARAGIGTPYSPGLVDKELAAGRTVFLDAYTDWCSTCAAQERAITALREENPAYDAISFVALDWDVHSGSELAQRLRIPRRSTLIVLKGNQELGRLVAQTSRAAIKDLLDTALAAATA
jgi:thioredoxin 1